MASRVDKGISGWQNSVYSVHHKRNALFTCSYGEVDVCPSTLGSLLSYSESVQEGKRLLDLSQSPLLSISGEEEMEGIGVG